MNGNNQNMSHSQISDRRSLMKSIYEIGFSLDDTILYLDTHPSDQNALDYYHNLHREYHELVKMYTQTFGPLLAKDVKNDNYFSWVNRPMPWEGDV